jgi:hypothetical protein
MTDEQLLNSLQGTGPVINPYQAKEDGVFTFPEPMFIHQPKLSNWTCYMFGGNAGFSPITWTPQEGKVPNAWVRFWMKVFFNCKWVKNDD